MSESAKYSIIQMYLKLMAHRETEFDYESWVIQCNAFWMYNLQMELNMLIILIVFGH